MTIRQANNTDITYSGAVERVMSLADFERKARSPGNSQFHLERMSMLLAAFDDPHLSCLTIHVAGTKGKGSVAAMMSSVLSAGRHRTGLYTSPHLHNVRERIRVDGIPITKVQFASLVDRTWPIVRAVSSMGAHGNVTTFEMMTLMAFLHFREVGADVQVVEVGLGGRLDSTNVVKSAVTVIVPISLDHTATLGDTIAKIAMEKAGIIKAGVPVVISPQMPQSIEAMHIIKETAARVSAEVAEVETEASWTPIGFDRNAQQFRITTTWGSHNLSMPLLGPHQMENAATAIVALEKLAPHGIKPMPDEIVSGFASVNWPCRVEYLPVEGLLEDVVVVADGAHNSDSVIRLLEAIPELRPGMATVVFGALAGHSTTAMLRHLSALSPNLVIVQSRHPKAASLKEIMVVAKRYGLSVDGLYGTVRQGMNRAVSISKKGQVVLATGSISVAAEAREWALGIEPECYPNIRPAALSGNCSVTADSAWPHGPRISRSGPSK